MSLAKHAAQHVAADIIKGAAQGAGCMVTLFAMISSISLVTLIVVLCV